MTPRRFFELNSRPRCQQVAEKAGTTFANFRHIARYNGACSPELAKELARASDYEMTLEHVLFRHEYDRNSETDPAA